jgi:DNA invertase Pin-like site-specific DNA recombinase
MSGETPVGPAQKPNMRIALSARVSTTEQAKRLFPIADQFDAGRKLCAERGWKVMMEEADDGISGTVWPRPGLWKILESARHDEIDIVVVWAYHRIARDEDLLTQAHILWEFRAAGVPIVSVTEPNASAIEINQLGVSAGLQLKKLKEDVERGMRSKASRREYTGGRHLFGYRWISKTEREIIPEQAAIVERAFELADPAGEHRQLAEMSRELGLELQRLRRMLRHPGYAGAYTYSRFTFAGSRNKMARPAPPERQVVHWGAHEPIVPRDRWDRVQDRLDEQARRRPHNNGQASLPLTGLIRCGVCHEPLRVCGSHRLRNEGLPQYYYRCHTDCCPGVGRQAVHGWTGEIVREVLGQLRRPDLADAIARSVRRIYEAGRRTGSWEAEVRRLERAESTVRGIITSGNVTDTRALATDYETVHRDLERARASLAGDRRRAGLQISAESIRARLRDACALLEELAGTAEADSIARPLLARFVKSVTILPGQPAVVQLNSEPILETEPPPLAGAREIPGFSFSVVLSGR